MKQRWKYAGLILALGAVIFYLFPLVFTFRILTIALLWCINPIYSFVFSMLYTVQFGLRLLLPVCIGALFLPAVFLFYDPDLTIVCVIYTAISFFGCCVGCPIYRRYHR